MSARNAGEARLTVTRLLAAAVVAASLVLGFLHRPAPLTIGDHLYYLFLAANAGFAIALFAREGGEVPSLKRSYLFYRPPEILLALGVVLFLFAFIYATNANMSYVQRFMATHGNIHLAPDSTRERLAACIQYLPVLALDAFWYVYYRVRYPALRRGTLASSRRAGTWALGAAILSAALYAFAFPSILRTRGLPFLSYIALVPLLVSLEECSLGWGVFYGTCFGVLQTMIGSYWLGTFDLLSLQFVTVVTLLEYIPFLVVSLLALRWSRGLGFLVFPAAWTAFDWLRSQGFLGYPWGMPGASQYSVIPLIQIASFTGVWGVTFLVVLCNSVVAWYLGGGRRFTRFPAPAIVLAAAAVLTLGWAGYGYLRARAAGSAPASVRLALIEQDSDPRKDNYDDTFRTLQDLTNRALAERPDLVVWSETAFVPNIRRWSAEDPKVYPLAALVR
ncbi:MAG TPA: hypothetical protein VFH83_01105, partial [Spirochaetia bacterium]|nr:hypothetical protein [Spirochaetia bacterium]